MANETMALNRPVIGVLAAICLVAAAVLFGLLAAYPDNSGLIYTQGGLVRMGFVLGALWLAMPSRNREAAWANISPKFLGLLVLMALVMIRVPPRFLIPGAFVAGIAILILRPRPKRRPSGSH